MVASTISFSGLRLVEGSKPNLPVLIANGIVNPLHELGYVPIHMLNDSSVDVTVYKGMEVVATRVEENRLAAIHSSGHSTYTEKHSLVQCSLEDTEINTLIDTENKAYSSGVRNQPVFLAKAD